MKRSSAEEKRVYSIRHGLLVATSGTRITVHDDNTFVITLDHGWAYDDAEKLLQTVANAATDLLQVFHDITEEKRKITVDFIAAVGGDHSYIIDIDVHKFKK
ncbi:hypothetical protein BH10CHL1_BH10CHL1_24340 [soil metagenome]